MSRCDDTRALLRYHSDIHRVCSPGLLYTSYTLAIHRYANVHLRCAIHVCIAATRYTAIPTRRQALQWAIGSGMCSSEPSPHPLAVPRPSHVTMLTCLLPSCPFRWTHWYTSPSFAHGQVRAYAELDKHVALHETENEQQQAPHTANWSTVRYSGDGSVVVDGRRSATEANRHAVPESLPGTVPGNVPGSAPGTSSRN